MVGWLVGRGRKEGRQQGQVRRSTETHLHLGWGRDNTTCLPACLPHPDLLPSSPSSRLVSSVSVLSSSFSRSFALYFGFGGCCVLCLHDKEVAVFWASPLNVIERRDIRISRKVKDSKGGTVEEV